MISMAKLQARIFQTAAAAAVLLTAIPALAQRPAANANVESKAINIWSDGTRLSGNLFWPKNAAEGQKLPAILLCHGWGGVKSHLNSTYAPYFANEGYVVMTFDYRGWGESDSRMVLKQEQPTPDANGEATVKVQLIREVVHPFDQLEDIQSALNYLEGEPMVDTDKIGIWGTSFGGGLVIWTAAHDDRIKAVVSQVGAMDSRISADTTFGGLDKVHASAIARARGEKPPVPQGENVVEGLRGTPYMEKFALYAPVDHASKVDVPVLLIDAENEELFDIKQHSGKVHEILKENKVTVKYHIEPGITHYGIYRERYPQGSKMALDWFNEHLKK